jgi:hypothetical protein
VEKDAKKTGRLPFAGLRALVSLRETVYFFTASEPFRKAARRSRSAAPPGKARGIAEARTSWPPRRSPDTFPHRLSAVLCGRVKVSVATLAEEPLYESRCSCSKAADLERQDCATASLLSCVDAVWTLDGSRAAE